MRFSIYILNISISKLTCIPSSLLIHSLDLINPDKNILPFDLNEILKFTKLMKKANNKITFILETPDEPNLNKEFELFINI